MPRLKKYFKKPADINVGVIGYGGAYNMGRHHLNEMKRAGMTPLAVCELDAERRAVAEQDFPGIATYASLDAMLKDAPVDVITHITPHNLHYKLAAQCVRAGKHVVVEKPLTITTAEADRLIALGQKHQVMVSTYHNRHWDGWIMRAVREIVDKQALGEVYKIDAHIGDYAMPKAWWRSSKSVSGGILYDWGVHLLEYSLQLLPQAKITEVSGYAMEGYWPAKMKASHPFKHDANEDEARALVRFDTGAHVSLTVSQLTTDPKPYRMAVTGTKGTYEIMFYMGEDRDGWILRRANAKGELVEKKGKHPKDRGHLFYKNVAAYLTGKEPLVITPEWARRPIHILDLAARSSQQGRALKAKYG